MAADETAERFRTAYGRDLHTWIAYSLSQVQELEAELFAYFVLAADEPPQRARVLTAALFRDGARLGPLTGGLGDRVVGPELAHRFTWLLGEREWLVHRSGIEGRAAAPGSEHSLMLLARLERIATEADGLRTHFVRETEGHLARAGMSEQEIGRRSEEVGTLWLAA
jgi:hypothetical protein